MRIRPLVAADWPAVEAVYAEGIADGEATFETATPTWEAFDAGRLPWLRLVAEDDDGTVLGWAAASPTSARRAYSGVVEHSVYVARDARGRGVGTVLLDVLVRLSQACGVWTLRSGVFPENAASLALHERAGFAVVGRYSRAARLHGRWRDVLVVERRSPTVGDDGPLVRLALPGDTDAVRALLAAAGRSPDAVDRAWRLWVAEAVDGAGDVVGALAVDRVGEGYRLGGPVVVAGPGTAGLADRLVEAALTVTQLLRWEE